MIARTAARIVQRHCCRIAQQSPGALEKFADQAHREGRLARGAEQNLSAGQIAVICLVGDKTVSHDDDLFRFAARNGRAHPQRQVHQSRKITLTLLERLALFEPAAQLPGQHVYLFTDSAKGLYEKVGFQVQGMGMGRVVGEWLVNEVK